MYVCGVVLSGLGSGMVPCLGRSHEVSSNKLLVAEMIAQPGIVPAANLKSVDELTSRGFRTQSPPRQTAITKCSDGTLPLPASSGYCPCSTLTPTHQCLKFHTERQSHTSSAVIDPHRNLSIMTDCAGRTKVLRY